MFPNQHTGRAHKAIKKPKAVSASAHTLELSIENMDYPAYLLNHHFQLEWCNDLAGNILFGGTGHLSNHIEDRNIFQLLFESATVRNTDGFPDILSLHLALAKNKLSNSVSLINRIKIKPEYMTTLLHLHDQVEPADKPIVCMDIEMAQAGDKPKPTQVFASFFREGILIVFMPETDEQDPLLRVLARRDLVLRHLLCKRRPYLTHMAVLVADLQSSFKICAELPPEEYFELINEIWKTMEPLLRKYFAASGKHAGDGVVYYFLPHPEKNYILNALRCAYEMKEAMRGIDRAWRIRKNWSNKLLLNIGIDQGEEWFGCYQTATQLELTALGETVNRTGRLSEFSRDGRIWTTKNVLFILTQEEKESIHFGIRRSSEHESVISPASYAQISSLVDIDNPRYEKMLDIRGLPVTEIFDVAIPDSQ